MVIEAGSSSPPPGGSQAVSWAATYRFRAMVCVGAPPNGRSRVEIAANTPAGVVVIRTGLPRTRAYAAATSSLLHELALVPLDEDILESASMIGDVGLRTSDALHLASAASLGSRLTALVAYDLRLLDAADALGLPTGSPT